ncbi:Bifunctional inhibitor/plant lipid transfer protein/seed storage helical domain superfamily [Arabidopsis suecica]|uniref:Bifunctional inhibitor/plant lipid transfer protein/seed storage helical domain superfamily n=1 Tax=Arabidopsis suecica TaxID=45249 RepID=A0A8T2BW22_ARASU|nr:Bifunctional inhibitor/plant lipid transfer protein/seed storage helical domain superfamily [Arabidopsis suecica]
MRGSHEKTTLNRERVCKRKDGASIDAGIGTEIAGINVCVTTKRQSAQKLTLPAAVVPRGMENNVLQPRKNQLPTWWWAGGWGHMGVWVKVPSPGFESSLLAVINIMWEVCQLGFGPIGLPGSQKCRRPDYPLALSRKAHQTRDRQSGSPKARGMKLPTSCCERMNEQRSCLCDAIKDRGVTLASNVLSSHLKSCGIPDPKC